jgi:hypothetical protein
MTFSTVESCGGMVATQAGGDWVVTALMPTASIDGVLESSRGRCDGGELRSGCAGSWTSV